MSFFCKDIKGYLKIMDRLIYLLKWNCLILISIYTFNNEHVPEFSCWLVLTLSLTSVCITFAGAEFSILLVTIKPYRMKDLKFM